MIRNAWSLLFFALALAITSPMASAAESAEAQAKKILKKMTLEEKVGQMTQLTLDVVSSTPDKKDTPHTLDQKKLEEALLKYHVGSILNILSDEMPTARAFSTTHWRTILNQIQDVAMQKSRMKIPVLYGIDAIHGVTYTEGGTLFPQSIALAATRNPDLVRKAALVTAQELKASGILWNFNPVLDVARQPLWSRVFETFGEDTYLTTLMGEAYIKGHDGVGTTLKHYIGYSYPWSGKDRTPAQMSERVLRETFLPPFAAGVKAGAPSVMINSASIDSIPGHINKHLLIDILRGELKFKGFTVSDWQDIERLHTRDRVAPTLKEAVKIAVMAGVDMSMVPFNYKFPELLVELVKEKQVPMSRIDEAVTRILAAKINMGLFKTPVADPDMKEKLATPEATALNLHAAREAMTLLKNEKDILPLAKTSKVLVAGPHANLMSSLNGGWSITWQGHKEEHFPTEKHTVLEAIQEKIGKDKVITAKTDEEAIKAAKNKKADVAIICIGEKPSTETPGNINDLTLDQEQLDLVTNIQKTGIPVVLVLIEGRPRIIRTVVEKSNAILMAYLPGMEGGVAIADTLFGDSNPSGKLPFTYPKFPNSLTPYNHLPVEVSEGNKYDPQWPFGFGLSYTKFKYSNLQIDRATASIRDNVKVSVDVSNIGQRQGKESVELYITDNYASIARPVQELKNVEKVDLKPGESKTVAFTVTPADLSFINANLHRVTEPGEFNVRVGDQTGKFELVKVPVFKRVE